MALKYKIPIIILCWPILIILAGIFMVGPQIIVTLFVSLAGAVSMTIKRSYAAFIFIGFPLLFGFFSALIGLIELPHYVATTAFWVSMLIGLLGFLLVSIGLYDVVDKIPMKFWIFMLVSIGGLMLGFLILTKLLS